jgi:hypothetical protein
MNPSDTLTRYCRVALYPHRDGVDCDRRTAHHRTGITNDERSRQLATLRIDHRITGSCWNPK